MQGDNISEELRNLGLTSPSAGQQSTGTSANQLAVHSRAIAFWYYVERGK